MFSIELLELYRGNNLSVGPSVVVTLTEALATVTCTYFARYITAFPLIEYLLRYVRTGIAMKSRIPASKCPPGQKNNL